MVGQMYSECGKKLQMIQAAFIYMGKPAVFNRILGKYPDMQIINWICQVKYNASFNRRRWYYKINKTYVLDKADALGHEYVNNGQITTADHNLIKGLSMAVRTEHDYMDLCDSLGVLLEYGPLAIPKYRTWMSQSEVTLIKFFHDTQVIYLKWPKPGQNLMSVDTWCFVMKP